MPRAFATAQRTATPPQRRCSVYCWRLPQCSSQPRCRCAGDRCIAGVCRNAVHSHAAAVSPPQALNQHNCARHRCPASTRRRLRVVRRPLRTRRALRANRSPRARRARGQAVRRARAVHGGRNRRAQICEYRSVGRINLSCPKQAAALEAAGLPDRQQLQAVAALLATRQFERRRRVSLSRTHR